MSDKLQWKTCKVPWWYGHVRQSRRCTWAQDALCHNLYKFAICHFEGLRSKSGSFAVLNSEGFRAKVWQSYYWRAFESKSGMSAMFASKSVCCSFLSLLFLLFLLVVIVVEVVIVVVVVVVVAVVVVVVVVSSKLALRPPKMRYPVHPVFANDTVHFFGSLKTSNFDIPKYVGCESQKNTNATSREPFSRKSRPLLGIFSTVFADAKV